MLLVARTVIVLLSNHCHHHYHHIIIDVAVIITISYNSFVNTHCKASHSGGVMKLGTCCSDRLQLQNVVQFSHKRCVARTSNSNKRHNMSELHVHFCVYTQCDFVAAMFLATHPICVSNTRFCCCNMSLQLPLHHDPSCVRNLKLLFVQGYIVQ